jgi:release factor glutamine methyltransferase
MAPASPDWTDVASCLREVSATLSAAGILNAGLEARFLLGGVLGKPGLSLVLHGDLTLSAGETRTMAAWLSRRLDGEPVARILGHQPFWGLDFALGAETLVPRADSEVLVEAALAHLGTRKDLPLRILDLGTGSGCLLIVLLHECGHATGIGVDRSAAALVTARANAALSHVAARALWLAADWGDALIARFDLVISNPPYIRTGDLAGLATEVIGHDPQGALDGGPDGLAAYRALSAALPLLLAPGGIAILELGAGQLHDVSAIMSGAGLAVLESRKDLGGHARALVLARNS